MYVVDCLWLKMTTELTAYYLRLSFTTQGKERLPHKINFIGLVHARNRKVVFSSHSISHIAQHFCYINFRTESKAIIMVSIWYHFLILFHRALVKFTFPSDQMFLSWSQYEAFIQQILVEIWQVHFLNFGLGKQCILNTTLVMSLPCLRTFYDSSLFIRRNTVRWSLTLPTFPLFSCILICVFGERELLTSSSWLS
jgi:hypothetical protein